VFSGADPRALVRCVDKAWTMSLIQQIDEQATARRHWLDKATRVWAADPTVVAAWLWGSEGRGTADVLSDFDLFVVLADDVALDGIELRFAELGDVVWSREVLYNAPAGGRYFSVGYPVPLQPITVDWYWQPHTYAAVGLDTRVLIERQPLPRMNASTFETFPNVRDAVPYQQPEDPRVRLEGVLAWFWFMFGPLSKKIARGQHEQLREQLPLLDGAIAVASHHAGIDHQPCAITGDVSDLRSLADRMLELQPLLDVDVPKEHIRSGLNMLALAEGLIAEGWTPTRRRDPL
jgi:predicted nucleotidyltransferase